MLPILPYCHTEGYATGRFDAAAVPALLRIFT